MDSVIPEKSTNQLVVWRELLDALDQLDLAWQKANPVARGANPSPQLPGNIAVALVTAAERGARAVAGVTDILVAQHDSGEAFGPVALALRTAMDAWPAR